LLLGALLCACAAPPARKAEQSHETQRAPAATSAAIEALPATEAVEAVEPAATVPAEQAGSFSTRHAHFDPARFDDLPGWREDRLSEAWRSYRQSCAVLAKKPAWQAPCAAAAAIDGGNDEAIRRFFEQEFVLYQIRNVDKTPTGVVTGYFEPLLKGSRRLAKPYLYPVYGTPENLLLLNARSMTASARERPVYARVVGRNVIPVANAVAGPGVYRIDLGQAQADIRDKKLRVRADADRIVPYYTRAEIERGALQSAPILAWVDNPAALYSMQVQGSGKVRLPDGSTLRLAYAEQNGHPFLPAGKSASDRRQQLAARVRTRGGLMLADTPEGGAADDGEALIDEMETADAEAGDSGVTTRGLAPPGARAAGAKSAAGARQSAEVEQVIEALSRGAAAGTQSAAPTGTKATPTKPATPGKSEAPPAAAEQNDTAAMARANQADPSYVFFREIPDSDAGPIGALGVPLTAGRSVAVDPRTTPLGFPVFLVTADASTRLARITRLMMAQDTGGAIRGAVRADYFWGFGATAGAQASRMKENGRMWLLLPKGQQVAAKEALVRTRGIGGEVTTTGRKSDCLVPDPDLCVED
jgi:membrane-bound lytic murein transglycosylase A